jgi:hypothetical protein
MQSILGDFVDSCSSPLRLGSVQDEHEVSECNCASHKPIVDPNVSAELPTELFEVERSSALRASICRVAGNPMGLSALYGVRKADLIQKGGAVPPFAATPECGMSSEIEDCAAQSLCRRYWEM